VNAPLDLPNRTLEADCAWLAERLDGFATHATRAAFERDRSRDRALQAAGWRVVRITWRQLDERSGEIAAELRALLGGARHA
jgi:very-short-patch-repair endonuclease